MTDKPETYVTEEVMVRALNSLDKQLTTKVEHVSTVLEQYEKQLAILVQGYAELTAIVESIFSLFINNNEEQKEEFFNTLAVARKTMIETLQHGFKIAEANSDKFVAHTTGADGEPASDAAPIDE